MIKHKVKNFISNLLKEDGKWSLGRVFLTIFVVSYISILSIVTLKGIHGKSQLDIDSFKITIDALQFGILTFGGYVFGGKFINMIPMFRGNKESKKTEE